MIHETFCFDGNTYAILIGQNKNENSEIISSSHEDDVWFHVEDMPSCHVILRHITGVKKYPKQVIKRCAYLCKIHSKAKTLPRCTIIYTHLSNVTTTDVIGEVVTRNTKWIQV
jgi:predicted ribosome quality control (RQC) complex YloA/Tae2 family protein